MIQIEHVSKFVLKEVDLHIPAGKAVGLIGESGAGKTTLLKLVSGLLRADEGRVSTMGHEPVRYRKRYGRDMSAFFAGIPLLESEESVRTGFDMLRTVYGMKKSEYAKEYAFLSQTLGFEQYDRQTVKELSLGQKMRVELGAALLYSPKLLLLDEPTVGLDQNAKEALRKLLRTKVDQGMTLLISSHDMNEISHLCDRIAVLHKGELKFYGDEEHLRRRHQLLHTMKLRIDGALPDLGDIPFLRYSIENNLLTITYSLSYITSAEILKQIMQQTTVVEIVIREDDLGGVISRSFEQQSDEGAEREGL